VRNGDAPLLLTIADVNAWHQNKTALLVAASKGDAELVRYLIAAGAEVRRSAYSRRALVEAASNNHLEVVRALIAAKADVNAGLVQGEPALLRAVANGNVEMARI
jgi:ankyrin repeat protein